VWIVESTITKKTAATAAKIKTERAVIIVSRLVGQVTRLPSTLTSLVKRNIFEKIFKPLILSIALNKFHTVSHFRMAGVEGIEPTTFGFGDRCSSRLSYTPKKTNIGHQKKKHARHY
jgi:hypothetical protein